MYTNRVSTNEKSIGEVDSSNSLISMSPIIKILLSGWTLIWFSRECFAQVPTGWKGELPDEYIFNPEWNRDRINRWWAIN
jgi:hypothetical protein